MSLFGLENLDVKVTPYEIEKRVSQEELWSYCLGHCQIGKRIKIPWERDDNPSASLFRASSGQILLQDHRNNQTYNIYHALIKIGKVESFREAVTMINEDFNLGLGKLSTHDTQFRKELPMVITKEPAIKFKKDIKIIKKDFTIEGFRYWKQFGINPTTLRFFNVHQISGYHIQHAPNEDYYSHSFPSKDSLVFAFEFFDVDLYERRGELKTVGYKIYQPEKEEEGKWVGNVGKDVIQGELQYRIYCQMYDVLRVKDTEHHKYNIMKKMYGFNKMWELMERNLESVFQVGLITKSLKDVMVWYEMGIISVAPQNETPIFPSSSLMYDLSTWFGNLIVNYDDDVTGRRNAIRLIQTNKSRLHEKLLLTTPCKDISDYCKEFGFHMATQKFKTDLTLLSLYDQMGFT